MPFVRNRVTGLVHEVPAGHPALIDDRHVVLPAPEPVQEPETEPEPVDESAPKRRRRK